MGRSADFFLKIKGFFFWPTLFWVVSFGTKHKLEFGFYAIACICIYYMWNNVGRFCVMPKINIVFQFMIKKPFWSTQTTPTLSTSQYSPTPWLSHKTTHSRLSHKTTPFQTTPQNNPIPDYPTKQPHSQLPHKTSPFSTTPQNIPTPDCLTKQPHSRLPHNIIPSTFI